MFTRFFFLVNPTDEDRGQFMEEITGGHDRVYFSRQVLLGVLVASMLSIV